MKFFTREWHAGEVTEEESDAAIAAYQEHVAALLPELHATVRALAREVNLHDGLIRRVVLDRAARELRLELRCGDRQAGYFDLDLIYLDAIVDFRDSAELASAASDDKTEILYDEIDVIRGSDRPAYIHRILFWPYRDVEIMFRGLELRLSPRADRAIPLLTERYVERSAGAG